MKTLVWATIFFCVLAACGHSGSVLPALGGPHRSAAASTDQYIDYVFVAHPDDEIEGWAGFQHDPQAYPVIIMLTRGEATSFCNTSSYNQAWQPQYNELPASPVPTLTGTETCAQARVNSYLAYMDDMASADPQHDDVIGKAAPMTGNGPPMPANCYARSTKYWLWAGAHHARLVLDIGDGHVQPCAISWALQVARQLRPMLAVQTEMNAIGDAFYGTPAVCGGSPNYDHQDHLAIYTAMRTTKLGLPGNQYQLVCQNDGASVSYALPAQIQNAAWPSITGATERYYGWLTIESSPPPAYCCYAFQFLANEWFSVTGSSGSTPSPSPSPPPNGGTAPSPAQWQNGQAYAPSSITVSWPSVPKPGDVLLVAFWNNGQSTGAANTYTPPAGWTAVDQNSGTYATYQSFAHVVAAGETNAYAFRPLAAQRQHVWIGVDVAGASGLDASKAVPVNGTSYTTPSLTPSQTSDLAIALNLPVSNAAGSWTNPSTWTIGTGPTSVWHGEAVYRRLISSSPVSESSTSSTAVRGFSAIVLLKPSGTQPTSPPTESPTPTPTPTIAPTDTPAPTPMPSTGPAPSPVQWTNGAKFAPASIAVAWPAPPAPGHVLLVAFWNNGQTSGAANYYTPPAGWTAVDRNAGTYATYQAFSHVVSAGETGSYTFKPQAAQREQAWIGVDLSGASGVEAAGNFLLNATSFTTPAIVPSQAGDVAVAFDLPIGTASFAWTNPSGWTLGTGPTSVWYGEALYQQLASAAAVSETSTLSTRALGFSALVLVSPERH